MDWKDHCRAHHKNSLAAILASMNKERVFFKHKKKKKNSFRQSNTLSYFYAKYKNAAKMGSSNRKQNKGEKKKQNHRGIFLLHQLHRRCQVTSAASSKGWGNTGRETMEISKASTYIEGSLRVEKSPLGTKLGFLYPHQTLILNQRRWKFRGHPDQHEGLTNPSSLLGGTRFICESKVIASIK